LISDEEITYKEKDEQDEIAGDGKAG